MSRPAQPDRYTSQQSRETIVALKNTKPNPNIQNVRKPSATQIQPALTAEDFTAIGRGGGTGGGFIRSNHAAIFVKLSNKIQRNPPRKISEKKLYVM
jgi:hypothetical protein